ncbi:DEAD-box type RNA helicase [Glugoides intestinalis]
MFTHIGAMKQHIFCELEEKAAERLQKMYSAYDLNPNAILKLIDTTVSNCNECLKIYLECNPNQKLERERICMDITPKKIYSWELLLDDTIRAAYKKCISSILDCTGFDAVIIMIKDKISEDYLWSTLLKKNPKLGHKEVQALLNGSLGNDVFVLKAIMVLLKAFPDKTLDDLAKFLFTEYRKDLKLHKTLTEYRCIIIQCYFLLLKSIPAEKAKIKLFYDDLVKSNRSDFIFEVFELFQDLIFQPYELFAKTPTFTKKMFHFLLDHIQRFDFNQYLTHTSIRSMLNFIHSAKSKPYITKKAKMMILFKKLTHWFIKHSNELDAELKNQLAETSFKQFADSAYYLLYVSLFLEIPILVTVLSNSNINGQILRFLTTKNNKIAKTFSQTQTITFLDEVSECKPCSPGLEKAGEPISRLLCFDFMSSIHFVKVFGFNDKFIHNMIKNLIFHGAGLRKMLEMFSINSTSAIQQLLNRAKTLKSGDLIFKKICSYLDNDSFSHIEDMCVSNSNLEIKASVESSELKNCLGNQFPEKFIDIKRKKTNLGKIDQQYDGGAIKNLGAAFNSKEFEPDNSSINEPLQVYDDQMILSNKQKIEDKECKIQGNMAQRIAEKTKNAFSLSKAGASTFERYGETSTFFQESLTPFAPIEKSVVEKIPVSFNSYYHYLCTFDPLRRNENISSIKNSMLDDFPMLECSVYNFDKVLRLKSTKFQYEMYDMLWFFKDKNGISQSGSGHNLERMNKNSFLGIVIGVNPGYFSNSEHEIHDLIEIYVLPSYSNMNIDKKLFYKYSGAVISNMREYIALHSIKSSKILKYLLRPSFLQDFFEQTISWDDKKLQFIESNNEKKSIIVKESIESQQILEKLLVNSHRLNNSQAEAVSKSFFSPERFFLIKGPPGTGKTVTIMSIISTFLFLPQNNSLNKSVLRLEEIDGSVSKMKILVCAPSNTAIDVIIARLACGIKNFRGKKIPIPFIKVGASNNPEINKYTLEYLVEKDCMRSKQKSKHELVSNASIICTTLNSSVSESIHVEKFDLIIVDEACQATELSTIIPFKYNPDKVILIGDPNQLPPTVLSEQPQLQFSLFERLLSYHNPVQLNIQYRMHPEICNLSSLFFYNNKIQTAEEVFLRPSILEIESEFKTDPLTFVDVCKNREKLDQHKSFYNMAECAICLNICQKLYKVYQKKLKIVILTPYKGQVNKLRANSAFSRMCVEISTIDGFQGKECDIVILSMVRQTGLGFTCDFRRINVAMTRAKRALFLIGSKQCLSKSIVWRKIINYIAQKKRYFTIKAFNSFLSKG